MAGARQAMKQTYGCHCAKCGELWDCFQVPCLVEVAIRAMKSNATCVVCRQRGVLMIMPERYEEKKVEKARGSPPAGHD